MRTKAGGLPSWMLLSAIGMSLLERRRARRRARRGLTTDHNLNRCTPGAYANTDAHADIEMPVPTYTG